LRHDIGQQEGVADGLLAGGDVGGRDRGSSGVAGVSVVGVVGARVGEGGVAAEATRPGESGREVLARELVSGPERDTKRGAVTQEKSGADGEFLAGSGAGWQAEAAGLGEQGGVGEEEQEASAHTEIHRHVLNRTLGG
jgi:hypothetical protein